MFLRFFGVDDCLLKMGTDVAFISQESTIPINTLGMPFIVPYVLLSISSVFYLPKSFLEHGGIVSVGVMTSD